MMILDDHDELPEGGVTGQGGEPWPPQHRALPVAIKYSPYSTYICRRDSFVGYLISFDIGLLGYRIEQNWDIDHNKASFYGIIFN